MLKISDNILRLNSGAIVTSFGQKSMEISVIQFGDPKCIGKILDTVELVPEYSQGFKIIWPFKN